MSFAKNTFVVLIGAALFSCGWFDEPKPTAATPQFDPPGGTYTEIITVTITTATAGAGLAYTIDGSNPAVGSTTKRITKPLRAYHPERFLLFDGLIDH